MRESLCPVLLGADLNCYSMARAFYETYGIKAVAFGQTALGVTRFSRCLKFTEIKELGNPDICRDLLLDFAKKDEHSTRLLIPCTDEYARYLLTDREALEPEYILPLPPSEAALALFDKSTFYSLCAEHGIPYPETERVAKTPSFSALKKTAAHLGAPFIIKPSDSALYWKYPFPHMEKAYLAHNAHEAEAILSSIFASGYPGEVLLQRYIAGGDAAGYVLTLYFDRDGDVALSATGRVLLEEHTPTGKGNYAALIPAPTPPPTEDLIALLRGIGYRGFANIDLRRDSRDGRFYVLELNLRQGRSNYFLKAGGADPARLLCDDFLLAEKPRPRDFSADLLYRTIPFSTLWHYAESDEDAARAKALHRAGKDVCPLYAAFDLAKNPRRLLYIAAHMYRQRKKFRRYGIPHR